MRLRPARAGRECSLANNSEDPTRQRPAGSQADHGNVGGDRTRRNQAQRFGRADVAQAIVEQDHIGHVTRRFDNGFEGGSSERHTKTGGAELRFPELAGRFVAVRDEDMDFGSDDAGRPNADSLAGVRWITRRFYDLFTHARADSKNAAAYPGVSRAATG